MIPKDKPNYSRKLMSAVIALVGCCMFISCSHPSSRIHHSTMSIDSLLQIRSPSHQTWSPLGERLAYVEDQSGLQNLWIADARTRSAHQLTHFSSLLINDDRWVQDGPIKNLFWGPRGRTLYFEKGPNLWKLDLGDGAKPVRAWPQSKSQSSVVFSPNGEEAAFIREGDLWIRTLKNGAERQLTRSSAIESNPVWSPDGRRIAFTSFTIQPEKGILPVVGRKILFTRSEESTSDVGIVAVSGGPIQWVGRTSGDEMAPHWIDAEGLAFERVSADLKTREILSFALKTGQIKLLHREEESRWWSLLYFDPGPLPSPNGRMIAFLSDATGWDHLYVMPSHGGEPHQLTHGHFEVRRPSWSPDGSRLAFDASDADMPGIRHLTMATFNPRSLSWTVKDLTKERSVDTTPRWSADGRVLVFQRTTSQFPAELFLKSIDTNEAIPIEGPRDSLPESLHHHRFSEPQFVRYPSSDGKAVPAYLFVPPNLDRNKKNPAIVWVHGDGVTQNYDGWHIRRDYAVYYSFHQYLVDHGYVVLAVDYRGSIGYGKAWREADYRDLGGKDLEDVLSGVKYLASLGYVNPQKVGVWGLSYGGYLTLEALTKKPKMFSCGVDVAGVVDWRDWYRDPGGPWIQARLGSPQKDPQLYDQTSPIHRIERIQRPLLVLAGTADVNVPFAESLRLVDALVMDGKDFHLMVYPGEFHYFQRSYVLKDAWTRVAHFFDSQLRLEE